jgi:hypothetical protein
MSEDFVPVFDTCPFSMDGPYNRYFSNFCMGKQYKKLMYGELDCESYPDFLVRNNIDVKELEAEQQIFNETVKPELLKLKARMDELEAEVLKEFRTAEDYLTKKVFGCRNKYFLEHMNTTLELAEQVRKIHEEIEKLREHTYAE